MAQVNVSWTADGEQRNLMDLLDLTRCGVLTTEHAASSHGIPVVVGEDGTAYGPAEIMAALKVDEPQDLEADQVKVLKAARRAGYTLDWTPAPKYRIVTVNGRGLKAGVDVEGYDTEFAADSMAEIYHDGEYRIEVMK